MHRSNHGSHQHRMSTRPNTYLASMIAAWIEASIEPRHGSIGARCGSLPEASMEELRHGSIETRCGSIEEASIGGSDDRTRLAIEAIIEVTKVAEQVSKRGIEASKRGIEASKKRQSTQVSKRGRVEGAISCSSDRNE